MLLSNEGGIEPLSLGAVHVGLAGPDGAVRPGSDHVVTFAGHGGVIIPGGAPLLSDAVAMPVKALDRLAISLHVPGRLTVRGTRSLFHYVAGPAGDSTAVATLPQARLARAPAIVTEIEVAAGQPTNVIVTLGDSITRDRPPPPTPFAAGRTGWPSGWRRCPARNAGRW